MSFVEKKLHYYYLFTSAIYVVIYIFLTPPFYTNDEFSHFQKASSKEKIYLNGNLSISKNAKEFAELFYYMQLKTYISKDSIDDYENLEIRKNIQKTKSEDYLNKFILSGRTNFNYSRNFYQDTFAEYEWNNDYTEATLNNLVGYPITGYIFSKLGVEFSKLFSNKIYISFYTGRLFNAIFCIIVIFFALKYIKNGKEFLFAIFSLPTVLKLTGSFSQDGILFAYSLLITLIFNFLNEDKDLQDKKKQTFFLLSFVLLLFISCARPSYVVFFSLTLIFYSKKYFINKSLIVLIPIIISSLFFLSFINYYPMPISPSEFTDGSNNIDFLISSPFIIIKILINDFINNFTKYSSMLIGFMGHGNFYLDYRLKIIIGFFFVAIFILSSYKNIIFNLKNLFIILICFSSVIITQVLQYIYSTSPGRIDLIQGVDARYFIPNIIFLSLIFKNMHKELNAKIKIFKNTALLIIPHFNMFVLFQMYEFFYFPKF